MKYLAFFSIAMFCSIYTCIGQSNVDPIAQHGVMSDGTIRSGERIYVSKPEPKGLEGSPYRFDFWMEGSIKLKGTDKPFEMKKIKYDVLNNYLDVYINNGVKSLRGNQVESFDLISGIGKTMHFKSLTNFREGGTSLIGFCEILSNKKVKLIERSVAHIKPATYNRALMIGKKDDKIILKREYYYSIENNEIFPLKKKRDIKGMLSKAGIKPSDPIFAQDMRVNRESLLTLVNQIN